jgi:hypothetical protein
MPKENEPATKRVKVDGVVSHNEETAKTNDNGNGNGKTETQKENDESPMTVEEVQLYDRQIRLWGMEAQAK